MENRYGAMQACPPGSFAYIIRPGDTLFQLANRFNTTVDAITRINPGIDPNRLQIGQSICIPGATTPPPPGTCPNGFFHVIRAGDTYFRLSQQYGVSVDAIIRANPGVDPNRLQIGQRICIPGGTPPLPPCINGFYYTIRAGDTIFALSQRFNVSVEAIIGANPGINPNNLQIGQTICIPRAVTPGPPCPNGFLYSIRAGDTLFAIGQRFNVSVDAIIRANPGIDPNNLRIGQVICIPTF
ncbi:LysM peptidoglycan-binding domain-containing protein [Tepidimicrobium xylanilyticum]|uniref:LysM peptidoglycan-binding domain-containing protein n=1 Tax=Tepidimicrobium xylanilyticum TaxID=1123352 RepID=UPI00264FF15D|nr:LysM domain-containing protein [Tepidimicrobium xylanilyticum]GMG97419.1 hypothetical protein EN5CB1_22450 [Tepidimicrobium xylanilyticum]